MKFLMFNDDFWDCLEPQDISRANIFALIRLLYISFEWQHKKFFRTQEQLLKELHLNRMGLSRFLTTIKGLDIKVECKNKKYYFNLSDFFDTFAPISNKTVTKKENGSCNETVTNDDVL
jgi:hypothetical protein